MDLTDETCAGDAYLHGGNETIVVHRTALIKENGPGITVARFGSAQLNLPVASSTRQLVATLS